MSDQPAVAAREGLVKPPFPRTVLAAGVVWVLFGSLGMLFSMLSMVFAFVLATDPRGGPVPSTCPQLLGVFFSGAFIYVGAYSIRGTPRDTLGNGIGSMIFGVLELGVSILVLALIAEARNTPAILFVSIGAGIYAACGMALLFAGVFALMGRSEYLAWRLAQRPRRRRVLRVEPGEPAG